LTGHTKSHSSVCILWLGHTTRELSTKEWKPDDSNWWTVEAITQCLSNQRVKTGPLKSEAQGLDLSVNITCDEFLRAFHSSAQTCFAVISPPFFATVSWLMPWMHHRLFADVGLGKVIGVKMGGRGMVLSWVIQRLSFGQPNSFSISSLPLDG